MRGAAPLIPERLHRRNELRHFYWPSLPMNLVSFRIFRKHMASSPRRDHADEGLFGLAPRGCRPLFRFAAAELQQLNLTFVQIRNGASMNRPFEERQSLFKLTPR